MAFYFHEDSLILLFCTFGDHNVENREEESIKKLEVMLEQPTAAVIVEPLIQGAGGMEMVRPEFLQKVQALVRQSGALLIEKHFTLDRSLEGPDHKLSSNPGDFKKLVDDLKIAYLSKGIKEVSTKQMGDAIISKLKYYLPQ